MNIQFPHIGQIEVESSAVILGPNGVGKTRLGVDVAKANGGEFISALRNTVIGRLSPMLPEQATQQLASQKQQRLQRHWDLQNDCDLLFGKLLADDSASIRKWRAEYRDGELVDPEKTCYERVKDVWSRAFADRSIDFDSYRPLVRSRVIGEQSYEASQMSDGERGALYLIARCLDSTAPLIVVDEPEAHLHTVLAISLWNEIESIRPDCRFVYITHDVAFAMSRHSARVVVIRKGAVPEVASMGQDPVRDVFSEILGAATVAIESERIVFCEGSYTSPDYALYSSWFRGSGSVLRPVGSSELVVSCVRSLPSSGLGQSAAVVGIIDGDVSQRYGEASGLWALQVAEVENLFCLREAFLTVAEATGRSAQAVALYSQFMERARRSLSEPVLCRLALEQAKSSLESSYISYVNQLRHSETVEATRKRLAPPATRLDEDVAGIFQAKYDAARASVEDGTFLQVIPGKLFLGQAPQVLGISPHAYSTTLSAALRRMASKSAHELESTLQQHLPPRDA